MIAKHTLMGAPVMLFMILAIGGCSSTPQIASRWRTEPVQIDGRNGDWESVPSFAEKEKFTVAVQHDSDYFYLCFTTQDRGTQMQLMGAGLIVWFDPDGGTKKVFGINFPLGRREGGPPRVEDRGMKAGDDPPAMTGLSEQGMSSIDILGPNEGDRFRLSTAENSGIQVKISRDDQRALMYELKVPMRRSKGHAYALEARAGEPIGIGMVTPEADKQMKHEGSDRAGPQGGMEGGAGGPPGGMEGGGYGGHSGGMGGGHGSRGHGGGTTTGRPDPLDFWMKVTLTQNKK
jgi:hypothetical protein